MILPWQPYGVNQRGASFKYAITDNLGKRRTRQGIIGDDGSSGNGGRVNGRGGESVAVEVGVMAVGVAK